MFTNVVFNTAFVGDDVYTFGGKTLNGTIIQSIQGKFIKLTKRLEREGTGKFIHYVWDAVLAEDGFKPFQWKDPFKGIRNEMYEEQNHDYDGFKDTIRVVIRNIGM